MERSELEAARSIALLSIPIKRKLGPYRRGRLVGHVALVGRGVFASRRGMAEGWGGQFRQRGARAGVPAMTGMVRWMSRTGISMGRRGRCVRRPQGV